MTDSHNLSQYEQRAEQAAGITIDVNQLAPDEVVALYGGLTALSKILPGGAINLRVTINRFFDDVHHGLVRNNPKHAVSVYSAFAMSPRVEDRQTVIDFLDSLTNVDHDAGFAMWNRLLRDEVQDVRATAYDQLTYCFGPDRKANEEVLQSHALTWYDVSQLVNAYALAEQGVGVIKPLSIGSTALGAVIEDDAPGPAGTDQPPA